MRVRDRFPPLYECSACGASVSVSEEVNEDGQKRPKIRRPCGHDDATVWANRKVTLRGKGALEAMPPLQRGAIKLTLTVRQFLSALTGRSI